MLNPEFWIKIGIAVVLGFSGLLRLGLCGRAPATGVLPG